MTSLVVLADDSYLRDTVIDTGQDVEQLRTALLLGSAVAVPLCVLAAGLAMGVMLGRPTWARLALAACSSFSGIVCVGLSLVSPPFVVLGLAAFTVAYLLARRDVVDWHPPTRR
jgi:uncharacterized membrane protein YGL010W